MIAMNGVKFENGLFTIEKAGGERLHEDPIKNAILLRLRSYLNREEPKLVYLLTNLNRAQGNAITYKELRESIIAGDLDYRLAEDWYQDYTKFVKDSLQPMWEDAIAYAAKAREEMYPEFYFNPTADGVLEWTQTRAADFVTSVTQTQIDGLRAVVHRAAVLQDMNVDQLARAIRPMVGLYAQQGIANMNYYDNLIKSGTSEKRALDLSIRYGARQHRYRGYMIARQELAMAYNTGAHEAVVQAQEAGYMGPCVKVWSTAMDERVCDYCREMEGKIVGMDEEFPVQNKGRYKFTSLHPPGHIQCRCAVEYKEISDLE